jgi:hypothetical protein
VLFVSPDYKEAKKNRDGEVIMDIWAVPGVPDDLRGLEY